MRQSLRTMPVVIPQGAAPLVATDLHRTYHLGGHDLPVLRGVNLTVNPGEKIFLCGASGSGKRRSSMFSEGLKNHLKAM